MNEEYKEFRLCGNTWKYCNGMCCLCSFFNYITTSKTEPLKENQFSNNTVLVGLQNEDCKNGTSS